MLFGKKKQQQHKQAVLKHLHTFILKKEKSKMVMINRYFSFTAARFIIAVVQGGNSNISKVSSFFFFYTHAHSQRSIVGLADISRHMISLHTICKCPFCSVSRAHVLLYTRETSRKKSFSFSCSQRCPLIGRHTGVETSLLVADPHPRQSLRDAPQGEGCSWHLPQVYQRASYWKG